MIYFGECGYCLLMFNNLDLGFVTTNCETCEISILFGGTNAGHRFVINAVRPQVYLVARKSHSSYQAKRITV